MIQRNISLAWRLKLLTPLIIPGVVIPGNPAYAQVTPDTTLGAEQSIVNSSTSNGSLRQQIEGGAIRGSNLFHSFRDFNIPEGQSLYFQNPIDIRNIIGRVTGRSPSNLEGTLGVSGGTANVFLINPNGIIFGANARLDVKGSFVATTASAIQFGTQGFFSSSAPESPSLLTVNPSALLFNQVAHAPIDNRSTALLDSGRQGLQVPEGQSLLLVGGNVNLAGGGVNAAGGRVELGAVAGTGTVALSLDNNDLSLSFPATLDRADISLTNGATVNTSGERGGSIQIWGRRVFINSGAQVAAFTKGAEPGGSLAVNASESLELIGSVRFGNLSTLSSGDGKAGDLIISTRNLRVLDGAQIFAGTLGNGSGGQLIVNASESAEVAGIDSIGGGSSNLSNFTGGAGQAGNLTVNTKRLIVRDGGLLSTQSILVRDKSFRVISLSSGEGGNLTINASDSVELIRQGFILASTEGNPGNPGNITINTNRLIVQDESGIGASSGGAGNAGNIVVQARSVALKNQSQIGATTTESQGGNITLQGVNRLLLRQGSSISTTAGTDQAGGDGGDITIDAKFIVAVPQEDSNITANAFLGRGGNVRITGQGIFGIEPRLGETSLSRITASSQFGIRGTIVLNTPNVDPSRGTATLPSGVIDLNALIASSCVARRSRQGQFVITGTGGLAPQPDDLANSAFPTYELVPHPSKTENAHPSQSASIAESDGIYRLPTGKVVLGRSCE